MRWLTAVGGLGVPQSRRASDMSGACARADGVTPGWATSAAAQRPARSNVRCMFLPPLFQMQGYRCSPASPGLSRMTKNSVIPTGAERSEAKWRDLFLWPHRQEQVPRLRRPLGGFARDDGIND